jgi:hypothetical protein
LTIRNFWKRGKAMREVLSMHSNLNQGRYIRLMALAAMEMFATIPLSIYIIYSNATLGGAPLPWVSWEDTHSGFSKVDQFPSVLWEDDSRIVINLELQRWLTVACAFVFVAFFGFADEARRHYRAAYTSLASHLGVTTISSGSFSDSTGYASLIVRVTRIPTYRHVQIWLGNVEAHRHQHLDVRPEDQAGFFCVWSLHDHLARRLGRFVLHGQGEGTIHPEDSRFPRLSCVALFPVYALYADDVLAKWRG